MVKSLFIVGGIINLGLGVFHLGFWKIFKWSETIASLNFMNKAIMQTLNVHVAGVLFFFGMVSIWFHEEMITTRLGHILTISIIAFYFLRAANQLIFWGVKHPVTWAMTFGFIAIGAIYLIPLLAGKG
jgi:hypothetical protein